MGGPPNELGTPISTAEAGDRIFGLVLMNDWSARDLQAWEMAPLGPFTAKNWVCACAPSSLYPMTHLMTICDQAWLLQDGPSPGGGLAGYGQSRGI